MSRSPGPGLSRVRRGTDTPGEWDRSSRSACGPHAPPSRLWAARGVAEGCGLRPDPGLPSLRDRGRLTQRTLSLASLGCVVVGGLPVVGGLHPTPRCSPPGRAERSGAWPSVVPLERSRSSQVPEAEWWRRSLFPADPPLGRRRWRSCPRWAGGRIGEGRHTRSPRCGERAPCRPRPATGRCCPEGCGGLTWWGELSDRGGPSRRRGAWPKLPLSEDCRFLA